MNAGVAVVHDFHVRLDHGFAEATEFFHVLRADHFVEFRLIDPEGFKKGRHFEKGTQKRVALHPQLQIGPVGGIVGDLESGQGENLDVVFFHKIAVFLRDAFPGHLGRFVRLPDERSAAFQPGQRVGVSEGLGITAEDDIHVIQLAVDPHRTRGRDEIVVGRRAFFLRAVFRVGIDEETFLAAFLFEHLTELADDLAEVFPGSDHAPAADGMEAGRDGSLGQKRGRVARDHGVGMVDAEGEIVDAIAGFFAIGPGGGTGGEFVGTEGVFGSKIAGTDPVAAVEKAGHLFGRNRAHAVVGAFVSFGGFGQSDADVAPERVVAGESFVGPLDDDDLFFPAQGFDHGSLGKWTQHVDVDGADFGVPLIAQIIAGFLDVFRGTTERDKHGVGVIAFILVDEAVVATGQFAEFLVGVFEKTENRFIEIIAPRHHAVHVVFLVLHRAEKQRIFQIHHHWHATPMAAEKFALGFGGAFDPIFRCAEIFPKHFRFRHEPGSFRVSGEHSVLDIHPGIQRQLGDFPQDHGLVCDLLRVFSKKNRPARVERGVDVIMPAVDVERVFREGASPDLQHHGRAFARRMIILLHGIGQPLTRGEIHDPFPRDRERRGPALSGVFALRFDGNFLIPPDIEFAHGVALLIEFATFSRGRDRVKNPAFRDARLDVTGHERVAVAGDADAGVFG